MPSEPVSEKTLSPSVSQTDLQQEKPAQSDSSAEPEAVSVSKCDQAEMKPETPKPETPKPETPKETTSETRIPEKMDEGTQDTAKPEEKLESTKALTLPKHGGNGFVLSRNLVPGDEEEDEEDEDIVSPNVILTLDIWIHHIPRTMNVFFVGLINWQSNVYIHTPVVFFYLMYNLPRTRLDDTHTQYPRLAKTCPT